MNPNTPTLAKRTVAVIMGGGAGTRLYPLTKDRAKPAVPLGGKYRLVDIPISNCLNSDLRRIYLLTQFNTSSLHRHIQRTYHFDEFSGGFVEIVAAQQTPDEKVGWYQGTADAVRLNLKHFDNHPHDLVVILSGDQLYRMNYQHFLEEHLRAGADISVGVIPVARAEATSFGIMEIDKAERITRFVEKPKDPAVLDGLRLNAESLHRLGKGPEEELYLASMGIYVFNRRVLHEVLDNQMMDFGKHIIPMAIERYKVQAHVFQGYWEDIGTIKAFFHANLDLCSDHPQFDFHDLIAPIHTRSRNLPPNKIVDCTIGRAVMATGSFLHGAKINNCIIGNRSVIRSGAVVEDAIIMGADYFESERPGENPIPMGIGEGSVVRRAIVDKNARVGRNCVIDPTGRPETFDHPLYHIRDGIVIIPKGAAIPDGMKV
jgi:glucose-1-phosphate adenylyltransferase